ncbi:hypothetical protein AB0C12_26325 [Actinoplanes sp. NPDC048967]|uniref:hypothetical protein n=1 Tax=Actinoplanes sp. NPDC048967 TaxID=3155269 RepID=UPI003404220C
MSGLDVAGWAESRIGRYFGLVSAVPSAVLVFYTYFLLSSGGLTGPPNWAQGFRSLTHISISTAAALSLVALLLGLTLHPLQFAIVQLYEGYWGRTELARRAALHLSGRHWEYIRPLRTQQFHLTAQLERRKMPDRVGQWLNATLMEALRASDLYPERSADFMPTRLGNVLRRYERSAGAPFGLDAVRVLPQLALVSAEKDLAYLNDQRSGMDLAVRLSATSLMATMVTVVWLWNDGIWLLVALIPYGLSYLFYCGAVVTAHEYGAAIGAVVALNRFALYERLNIPAPGSAAEERRQNQTVTAMLAFRPGVDMDFGPAPQAPLGGLPLRMIKKLFRRYPEK